MSFSFFFSFLLFLKRPLLPKEKTVSEIAETVHPSSVLSESIYKKTCIQMSCFSPEIYSSFRLSRFPDLRLEHSRAPSHPKGAMAWCTKAHRSQWPVRPGSSPGSLLPVGMQYKHVSGTQTVDNGIISVLVLFFYIIQYDTLKTFIIAEMYAYPVSWRYSSTDPYCKSVRWSGKRIDDELFICSSSVFQK